mmetsp:Transcript_19740/g.58552  ORF Transcript_19740/g.58552 Transcript_19740/m.58552 type:complete len:184 (-) Transcript_19740:2420-2971(-)
MLHVVVGLSKDFCASGLRVGALHTRCTEVLQAVDSLSYYASVSRHTQHVLAEMLADTRWLQAYLDENARRMRHSFGVLSAELKDAGIPFAESQAALFCWLDLREGVHACRQQRGVATAEWEDEERFWEALSFKHGVFLTPGYYCHAKEPGFFRMCFTWFPPEALPIAVSRIRAAIDSFKQPLL